MLHSRPCLHSHLQLALPAVNMSLTGSLRRTGCTLLMARSVTLSVNATLEALRHAVTVRMIRRACAPPPLPPALMPADVGMKAGGCILESLDIDADNEVACHSADGVGQGMLQHRAHGTESQPCNAPGGQESRCLLFHQAVENDRARQ